MPETDPIDCLRRAVEEAGSQARFAEGVSLPQSYISDVLNGNRPPSDRLLSALGLKRVVVKS